MTCHPFLCFRLLEYFTNFVMKMRKIEMIRKNQTKELLNPPVIEYNMQ